VLQIEFSSFLVIYYCIILVLFFLILAVQFKNLIRGRVNNYSEHLLLFDCSNLLHLSGLQVHIDCLPSLDIVNRLFESVAGSVFRPIDVLLKVLFAKPNNLVSSCSIQRLWAPLWTSV